MICSNCKKEIPDDSLFCEFCGCKVTFQAPAINSLNTTKQRPKNIYAIISIIVAMVLVCAAFFFLKNTDIINRKNVISNENQINNDISNSDKLNQNDNHTDNDKEQLLNNESSADNQKEKVGNFTESQNDPKPSASLNQNSVSDKYNSNYKIEIDSFTFPDEIFRKYVIDNFDLNKDDYLSYSELVSITKINVMEMKIESLKGIEFFTNLNWLNCAHNNIQSLDLSKNTLLGELQCRDNKFQTIDLSNNKNLYWVITTCETKMPNTTNWFKETNQYYSTDSQFSNFVSYSGFNKNARVIIGEELIDFNNTNIVLPSGYKSYKRVVSDGIETQLVLHSNSSIDTRIAVVFNDNSKSLSSITFKLTKSIYEKVTNSKDFVGWNTKSDGSGELYIIDNNINIVAGTQVHLYAKYNNVDGYYPMMKE